MASVGTNYDAMLAIHGEFVKTRRALGDSGVGAHRRQIPALTATDMLAAAVLFTPGCLNVITRVSTGYKPLGLHILNVKVIDGDEPDGAAITDAALNQSGFDAWVTISPRQYLAGWPVGGDGARRTIVQPPKQGEVYTVSSYDAPDMLAFLRSTMRAWQRVMNAMGAGFATYGFTVDMGKDILVEYFDACFALANSLDILQEVPADADIRGALRAAWTASKEAVERAAELGGQAIAEAAELAGRAAAGAGKGFLEGMGPFAIAGFVIYIGVRHYGLI